MEKSFILRSFGFILSLLFTLLSYSIIINPGLFNLSIQVAILSILLLAFLQAGVQFIFFMDLWREEGPPWNLTVFASTASIIFIIVFFSIWIMAHLDYYMMPAM